MASANNVSVDFSRAGKLFMLGKNSVDESGAPCGAHDSMGSRFEKGCWHTDLCLRSCNNLGDIGSQK